MPHDDRSLADKAAELAQGLNRRRRVEGHGRINAGERLHLVGNLFGGLDQRREFGRLFAVDELDGGDLGNGVLARIQACGFEINYGEQGLGQRRGGFNGLGGRGFALGDDQTAKRDCCMWIRSPVRGYASTLLTVVWAHCRLEIMVARADAPNQVTPCLPWRSASRGRGLWRLAPVERLV